MNILVNIPEELLEKVKNYQKDNHHTTRNSAVLELIRRGLESEEKPSN